MNRLSLAGYRVRGRRAAHQAGKLSDELRALGAEPVEVPVLDTELPPATTPSIPRCAQTSFLRLADLDERQHGARICRARSGRVPLAPQGALKVAAIGEATAAAAHKQGLPVTLIPGAYVAEAMVEALAKQAKGQKFLLARAEVARDVIVDALRGIGAKVDVVDAYRNVMPEAAPRLLREAMKDRIDELQRSPVPRA